MPATHQQTGLLHDLFESAGGRDVQELGWCVSEVLISVGNISRKEHKRARIGSEYLIAALDLVLSFQDIHGLVFATVNMQWKAAQRRGRFERKRKGAPSVFSCCLVRHCRTENT